MQLGRRRVVVGPKSALAVRAARIEDLNWLGGDMGAKPLIGENEDVAAEVEMDDQAVLRDIDTPSALADIRAETRSG